MCQIIFQQCLMLEQKSGVGHQFLEQGLGRGIGRVKKNGAKEVEKSASYNRNIGIAIGILVNVE